MGESAGYRELRESCAVVPVTDQSLSFLSGDDALEWLNGQVTQDLLSMEAGESRAACLCSVTGQIEAILQASKIDDRIAVQTDQETAHRLPERVKTSVFMEDVRFDRAPENWRSITIRGPRAGEVMPSQSEPEGLLLSMPLGKTGFVYWGPKESVSAQLKLRDLSTASEEAWESFRIENGEPRFGRDIDSKTLPQELGAKFLADHVSYAKGCYTGQEVLMRMYARGHANRSWVGLLLEDEVSAGANVSSKIREKAGTITSSAVSPTYGPIAAAMLHRDSSERGSEIAVQSPNAAVRGKVFEFPLTT